MNTLQSSWQRSTTRRFWCWLTAWRTLRVLLLTAVALLTLIALFYAVEDWRGKRAWNAHSRDLKARGEPITLTDMIPPPVADEQNFALTPMLRPIFEYGRGTNGKQWRDPPAMERLRSLSIYQRGGTNGEQPSFGNLDKGTLTDLEQFAVYYQGNTNYLPAPAGARPAQAVLTALGAFDKELRELKAAAAARPLARFPIGYLDEPPPGILLPHLVIIKGLVQIATLRSVANLDLGQTAEALTDVELAFRLSDSMRNEPLLIDHLVRLATLSMALQAVREGLARSAWTAPQLAQLEKDLAALDLLAEHQHAMRGERALSTATSEWILREGWRFDPSLLFEDAKTPLIAISFRLIPSGWYYQNMVRGSRILQQFSLDAVDVPARRAHPEICQEFGPTVEHMANGPYTFLVKLFLPALSQATMRSARMQALVTLAQVSCALERYRLTERRLPDALAQLVPKYLERIPNDVIDGQPIRYQVLPNGGYRLYSIGWNQQDDGGQLGWRDSEQKSIDLTQGDWVWSQPGK